MHKKMKRKSRWNSERFEMMMRPSFFVRYQRMYKYYGKEIGPPEYFEETGWVC